MIRLVDVAKKAGVSENTVSRVLNNRGYISDATREKVLKTIEELNYKPNQFARNLLKKKTDIVALLIQTIKYGFHADIISEVESELHKRGYNLLLCNAERSAEDERFLLNMLESYRVDGLIILNYELCPDAYEKLSMPIVSMESYVRDGIPFVTSDHSKGGELAANELIKCGCKNVLQISGSLDNTKLWNVRHSVFSEIMKRNHIECKTITWDVETFSNDIKVQRRITRELLEQYPDIDGFFAVDLFAAAMQYEAKKIGLKVPEDLKIVGYDGTIYSEIEDITTVSQDLASLAKSAVETICELIGNDGYNAHNNSCHVTQHNVELIERKSTRCNIPEDNC